MPQRQIIIGFRQDIDEMMRQMDRTLKLMKSVDSLVKGDEFCQLTRTMNTGDVMAYKITSSYWMPCLGPFAMHGTHALC